MDFGQYTIKDVENLLKPKRAKVSCARCGKTLSGNQKLYFGGLCGKCMDKSVKGKK